MLVCILYYELDNTLDVLVFYKLFKNNKISLPNENSVLTQYDLILDKLEKSGYENYEISNFAKKGYHSRHNSN